MNKQISVGDLVMVVKPSLCCGNNEYNGVIFLVAEISTHLAACGVCGRESEELRAFKNDDAGYLISRLKRIPPLSELEDVKVHETIGA